MKLAALVTLAVLATFGGGVGYTLIVERLHGVRAAQRGMPVFFALALVLAVVLGVLAW